jgi:hypothetical protein
MVLRDTPLEDDVLVFLREKRREFREVRYRQVTGLSRVSYGHTLSHSWQECHITVS